MDNGGQVDTFILDFEKHLILNTPSFRANYLGYGIKWIYSFLCYRQQRVVVNAAKSDWAPVLSGVPQGTVLGSLLFSLYINDISTYIDSELRLLANDCVCYREIKDIEDTLKHQNYIYISIGTLGKEMQYDANNKETDQKDPCFIYYGGNCPRKP